jgi:hypothetical protein
MCDRNLELMYCFMDSYDEVFFFFVLSFLASKNFFYLYLHIFKKFLKNEI